MESVYLLIPISLIIVALAIGIFFWAVKSGQYDDLEGPAWRILYDDDTAPPPADDGKGEGGKEAKPPPGKA
jgi:cbb3-type cytochrome oxidase maturation protein